MKRKYFFFDIDGTLTSFATKEVIPSALEAIRNLEAKGHLCALATGRSHFRAMEFCEKYGFRNMVCEGGNCVVMNDQIVHEEVLDQEKLRFIIQRADEIDLALAISVADDAKRSTPDSRFLERVGDLRPFFHVFVDEQFDEKVHSGKIRRILVDHDLQKIKQIPEIIELGHADYPESPFMIVECDDKYKGIKKMVELSGGDEAEIVVFGDGINDCKMFAEAPFGIAMGNACEKLKELADYVTDTNENDGILKAVEHFGWL